MILFLVYNKTLNVVIKNCKPTKEQQTISILVDLTKFSFNSKLNNSIKLNCKL